MKKSGGAVIAVAALIILALRLAAAGFAGPFWSVNLLRYLDPAPAAFAVLPVLLLLVPLLAGRAMAEKFLVTSRPLPAWSVALAFLALALALPPVATPLLGDGIDRIEAVRAGLYHAVRNHPAPLDIIFHHYLESLVSAVLPAPQSWFDDSWRTWRASSWAAGALAAALL